MSSQNPACAANNHLLFHGSTDLIITVWALTAFLQLPCFILILGLVKTLDFNDDPLAVPYVIDAPKSNGRFALMRSKDIVRFVIGLGLWILAATCFVFEGIAIREAQLCSFESANPKWAIPWTIYGIVQGLMLISAGLIVVIFCLVLHRFEGRGQKGKAKEESTSSVETGRVTVKKDEREGMWEMQELDPEEPARDSGTDGRRDKGRAMKGIVGEGSS